MKKLISKLFRIFSINIGCNKDRNDIIVLVTAEQKVNFFVYAFKKQGTIIVDWDDGRIETLKFAKGKYDGRIIYSIEANHKYSTERKYTIRITSSLKIKKISCYNNGISYLDISQCTSLEHLSCGRNKLISLDINRCIKLKNLYCDYNQLITLDVSKNVELEWLECSYNNLTSLDVSRNTMLKSLYCSDNQIVNMNVGMMDGRLKWLCCFCNQSTASAMNQIYNALPDRSSYIEKGNIYISQPYGDYSIAQRKGWKVYESNNYHLF